MRRTLYSTLPSTATGSGQQCLRFKESSPCPRTGRIARRSMFHLQFTDCRSLSDHLTAQVPRQCEDKRLSIEMAGLRQSLWDDETPTHVAYNPHGDQLRWILTHLQLADCLTKSLKPLLINQTIDSNIVQVRGVPSTSAPVEQGGSHTPAETASETPPSVQYNLNTHFSPRATRYSSE